MHRGLRIVVVGFLGLVPSITCAAAAQPRAQATVCPIEAGRATTPAQASIQANVAASGLQVALQRTTLPGAVPDCASDYLLDQHRRPMARVTFPFGGAAAQAIHRMANRQVSTGRNRCAATVRQALGWGLGDAHKWVELTKAGFVRRPAGQPAAPGDIVVWPFTFGSRRSEHIGIAVGTEAGPRLLSNLCGSICLSDLAPGYCAFYKPAQSPTPVQPTATLTAIPRPQTPKLTPLQG